jgi:cobyrinic acid a,c-diamide synthase
VIGAPPPEGGPHRQAGKAPAAATARDARQQAGNAPATPTARDARHTPRVVVAAPASAAGKTTVATGLMAALADRGLRVAGAKVGPDYIDPSYHRLATGRASATLDAAMSGPDLIAPLARRRGEGCDAMVIEGVMGLFDGAGSKRVPAEAAADAAPADAASTAHVARLLDAPVVLVVDASAASTSVAATVHGFATFDPRLRLAGVVANAVGSPRHAELIAGALQRLGVPLLGWLPRDAGVTAPGRHLGLVPAVERAPAAHEGVAALGRAVAAHVDVDAVLAAAATAPAWPAPAWSPPFARAARARVGVATGPAFSFAYPDDLDVLAAAGAELAWFDPTADAALPAGCDGLVLCGGFPEVYAASLSANAGLRGQIAALAGAGAPVRAECGGLAYLAASLDGQPMCGVLPARARMTDSLTLGYRRAVAASDAGGWRAGEVAVGHEFHYSVAESAPGRCGDAAAAWRVDGRGPEGFSLAGVHASYVHAHWAAHPHVADRFVADCAATREVPCA